MTARQQSASALSLYPAGPDQVLDALLNASPGAVVVLDQSGAVTLWSSAAEHLFGVPAAEAMGHPLPGSLSLSADVFESGAVHRKVPVEWAGMSLELDTSPVRTSTGEPAGAVFVFTDVTARERAQTALAASEQRFRGVFEQAPVGMAMADLDGHLLEVNAAFRRILDTGDEPPGTLRWEDFLEPGQPARNLSRLLAGIDRGQAPALQTDARFRTRSGRLIDVQWNLCLVTGVDGQPLCQIGQVADITRRKSAEKKLKHFAQVLDQSNQDLQQFAYAASHDLQEPLRMVRSYLELLARRYKGRLDADADEFIGYAVDGAARMQRLISGLLAYSRVGTEGKEFTTISTEASFRDALENLRVAVDESGAIIESEPLPETFADPLQVAQLFQNLLGNSIKFRSEAPPRIHVSVASQGDFWRFEVRDNGVGIEPKFADRAFQIFQRLQPAHRYAGTGIGLALCKRIVERHGGRIGIAESGGAGAVFWFTLPAASSAIAPSAAAAAKELVPA